MHRLPKPSIGGAPAGSDRQAGIPSCVHGLAKACRSCCPVPAHAFHAVQMAWRSSRCQTPTGASSCGEAPPATLAAAPADLLPPTAICRCRCCWHPAWPVHVAAARQGWRHAPRPAPPCPVVQGRQGRAGGEGPGGRDFHCPLRVRADTGRCLPACAPAAPAAESRQDTCCPPAAPAGTQRHVPPAQGACAVPEAVAARLGQLQVRAAPWPPPCASLARPPRLPCPACRALRRRAGQLPLHPSQPRAVEGRHQQLPRRRRKF